MSARVSSRLDLKPILRPIGQKHLGSFKPPNRLPMSLGVYTLHIYIYIYIYGGYPGIPHIRWSNRQSPAPRGTRPQVYVHWATYLVSPSIPSWFVDMAIISGTLWYNIYQRYTIKYHRYLQSYILVHWYQRIPRYTKGFPVVHWSTKYQLATLRMPLGTQFQRERPWDHRPSFGWWQKLRRSRWNVVEEVIPKTIEQEIRKCPLRIVKIHFSICGVL